jgi:hypothetical protein
VGGERDVAGSAGDVEYAVAGRDARGVDEARGDLQQRRIEVQYLTKPVS